MEYYSVIKKNEIVLIAGKWMEMEIIMLSEKASLRKTDTCFL
jgi:UDP-N-acetylmuramyl tripeptide synthase